MLFMVSIHCADLQAGQRRLRSDRHTDAVTEPRVAGVNTVNIQRRQQAADLQAMYGT